MKRKKKLQKLVSMLLALVMTLGLCGTSLASTLTITSSQAAHTYDAYQIFTGTYDDSTKILSDIEWGSGIKISDFVAALENSDVVIDADNHTLGSLIQTKLEDENISDGTTTDAARAIAEILQQFTDSSSSYYNYYTDVAIEIATLAVENKSTTTSGTGSVDSSDDTQYVIEGLDDGYYVVVDTTSSLGDDDAYSRYILQVVGDTEIATKKVVPSGGKQVYDEDGYTADANTVSVGDTVGFEITSEVPDYTGYDYYYFILNDTLTNGLDFDENSVVVKVNGSKLKAGTDYYLYTKSTNPAVDSGYTFQIAFANIKGYTIGDDIVVTYSATLNEYAVTGISGNGNELTITYSNDPDESEQKDKIPGKPDPKVPTGETPESITLTFLTDIVITKLDENEEPLAGATFTLTGISTQYVVENGTYYVIDDSGTYYLLKDGSYTDTVPNDSNKSYYVVNSIVDGSEVYDTYIQKKADSAGSVSTELVMTVTSDSNGLVTFSRLGEGTYTIEETGVPAGYNKAEDVKVVIECILPDVSKGETKAEWTVGSDSSTDVSVADGKYTIAIVNQKGSSLPSTGGTGTKIFYVVGIVLMLGAAVVTVTRKRLGSGK